MSDLPVVDPDEFERPAPEPSSGGSRVAGVVLAAGTSTRFGEANKLLAALDGEPLVRHAARTLVEADVSPVVVVVGYEGERVRAALESLPVSVVENPSYEAGQATSVQAGIDALGERIDAVVIALGDMPSVATESVDRLVEAYHAGAGTALAAGYEGQRGNPVLFDSQHFDTLRAVHGDTGGRRVLLDAPDAALVETGDPGVTQDVDRRDDVPD